MARLKELYEKEVVPALKEEFGLTNHMQVPIQDFLSLQVSVVSCSYKPDVSHLFRV